MSEDRFDQDFYLTAAQKAGLEDAGVTRAKTECAMPAVAQRGLCGLNDGALDTAGRDRAGESPIVSHDNMAAALAGC